MKIQKISSHGTVAVKEVEIKANTPITLICGSNRAGKTSLRDGIFQAFTGENPKVTLKQLPSGLSEDLIKCYWLEDGVIADQDLKAEAA